VTQTVSTEQQSTDLADILPK